MHMYMLVRRGITEVLSPVASGRLRKQQLGPRGQPQL